MTLLLSSEGECCLPPVLLEGREQHTVYHGHSRQANVASDRAATGALLL